MSKKKVQPVVELKCERKNQDLIHNACLQFVTKLAPIGVQMLVSATAYGIGLQVVQIVGAGLRVSCHTPVVSSVLGFLGMGAVSALSGQISRHVRQCMTERVSPLKMSFKWNRAVEDLVLDAVVGIAIFKLLGGSFRRLMPSDLRYPGAHGFLSLPASPEYISKTEKIELLRIYNRYGCHHCGSKGGLMIGDHIPPLVVVKRAKIRPPPTAAPKAFFSLSQSFSKIMNWRSAHPDVQRFFPQCTSCCKKQAEFLRHGRTVPFVLHRIINPPSFAPGLILGLLVHSTPPARACSVPPPLAEDENDLVPEKDVKERHVSVVLPTLFPSRSNSNTDPSFRNLMRCWDSSSSWMDDGLYSEYPPKLEADSEADSSHLASNEPFISGNFGWAVLSISPLQISSV